MRKTGLVKARQYASWAKNFSYNYKKDPSIKYYAIKWNKFPKRQGRRLLRKLMKGGLKPSKKHRYKLDTDDKIRFDTVNPMPFNVAAHIMNRLPGHYKQSRIYKKHQSMKGITELIETYPEKMNVASMVFNEVGLRNMISSYL